MSDARAALSAVRDEVGKAVLGQQGVLSGLLIALLVRGHVLLEGVPGTAKTLVVKALARALDLHHARVQFTPDLMPSDILGQLVLEGGTFYFRHGPVFTNLLLADEINRTPPKTQAALLEAMEERQVTVEGRAEPLPDPFLVVATQNPIEYEGTYPLPEAQLDRFAFKLRVGYPAADAEQDVLAAYDGGRRLHEVELLGIAMVADQAMLAAARDEVRALRTDPAVQRYIVELAAATRRSPSLQLGVSPRGSVLLLEAAKAWAWLSGRTFPTPDDVKAMALPAWRHRVLLRPEVELEGTTADGILEGVLAAVSVPR